MLSINFHWLPLSGIFCIFTFCFCTLVLATLCGPSAIWWDYMITCNPSTATYNMAGIRFPLWLTQWKLQNKVWYFQFYNNVHVYCWREVCVIFFYLRSVSFIFLFGLKKGLFSTHCLFSCFHKFEFINQN